MKIMEDNVRDLELSTYNDASSVTALDKESDETTLCFENQDYLSMSIVVDPSNMDGSGYEDVLYENMILPPPVAYEDVQTQTRNSDTYENFPPSVINEQTTGESLSIIKKLRIGKSDNSFWKYSLFTIHVVSREVESLIFLDVFYIFFGFLLLGFGVKDFKNCPLSATLVYFVLCYAGCAIVSSGLLIGMKCRRNPNACEVFQTIAHRSVKVLMIVCCLLGLVEVYVRFPPEECDTKHPNYCSPLLYWSVVYIFTLTAAIVAVIIVHIAIAVIWYFM